jgi:AcrR family transcriptional regulator
MSPDRGKGAALSQDAASGGASQARRRPGRQSDILCVFTEKVALQGYDATSLSEIAAELNMSKGTIMHHYGSKDRILKAMSMLYMQRRLREVDIILEESEDPAERLSALIVSLVTGLRDDHATTRAFSREFMRFVNDPVMADVRALRHEFTVRVQGILEQGMREGVFTCRSARVATLQIIGMCNWNWTWLDPHGPLDVDDIAAMYVENVLGGLSTVGTEGVTLQLSEGIRAQRARENGAKATARATLPSAGGARPMSALY